MQALPAFSIILSKEVISMKHRTAVCMIFDRVSAEKAKELRQKVSLIQNLKIDDCPTYHAGLKTADVFVSDISSLLKEFVFMGKPVICTVNDSSFLLPGEFSSCLSVPECCAELKETLCRAIGGYDEKAENRKAYCEKNRKRQRKRFTTPFGPYLRKSR